MHHGVRRFCASFSSEGRRRFSEAFPLHVSFPAVGSIDPPAALLILCEHPLLRHPFELSSWTMAPCCWREVEGSQREVVCKVEPRSAIRVSVKGQTQPEVQRWPCSCGRVQSYPIEPAESAPMTHSSQASSLLIQSSAASRRKYSNLTSFPFTQLLP